jgi:hypothetical protein
MFLVLLSTTAQAQYRLLDVDHLDMEVAKFGCNRDPIVPEIECNDWRGRVSLNADLRLMEYAYFKNEIHGEGTDAAFKTMGWHFELGLRLSKYIDVFYEHHSRHALDQGNATHISYDGRYSIKKFPVEDSYGLRFTFYESKRNRTTFLDKLYP